MKKKLFVALGTCLLLLAVTSVFADSAETRTLHARDSLRMVPDCMETPDDACALTPAGDTLQLRASDPAEKGDPHFLYTFTLAQAIPPALADQGSVAIYFTALEATTRQRSLKADLLVCVYVPRDKNASALPVLAQAGYVEHARPVMQDDTFLMSGDAGQIPYCHPVEAHGSRGERLGHEAYAAGIDRQRFVRKVAISSTDISVPVSFGENVVRFLTKPVYAVEDLFEGLGVIGMPKVSG